MPPRAARLFLARSPCHHTAAIISPRAARLLPGRRAVMTLRHRRHAARPLRAARVCGWLAGTAMPPCAARFLPCAASAARFSCHVPRAVSSLPLCARPLCRHFRCALRAAEVLCAAATMPPRVMPPRIMPPLYERHAATRAICCQQAGAYCPVDRRGCRHAMRAMPFVRGAPPRFARHLSPRRRVLCRRHASVCHVAALRSPWGHAAG